MLQIIAIVRFMTTNGKYTYPKIATKQRRYKGVSYFENVELTGPSEGTKKYPKFYLLKVDVEIIIPAPNQPEKDIKETEGVSQVVMCQ